MARSSAIAPADTLAQPRRVVGYVRLSRETEDSSSPAKQRQAIERLAAARAAAHPGHWELVGIHEDIDVSATRTELDSRPGLSRVRQAIADGTADAVVVMKLDRLARSVVDYGLLLREGLAVVSCSEPLDTTTPMGQAMVKVLLVFAELEAQTIGERIRATIAYRVSQGDRWRGASAPYGYRSVPHPSGDGRTLVVDPTEAAHIRAAADAVLGGTSLYATMQALNAAGSRPRKAATWSLSSLRVVLTGDSVLGRQTRHGEPLRDPDGVIATPWEPILPLADAERLRAILAPKALGFTRRKASRLLSGLLVCACGARLRVNSRRNGGAHIESYGCRAAADGKTECKAAASINADGVESYIVEELLARAADRPIIERREVIRDVPELAAVEEALGYATEAMRAPGADIAALAARVQELVARRDELAAAPVEPTIEEVATGETYGELWARTDDVAERRAMIEAALEGPIVVRPVGRGYRLPASDRVSVPWRFPSPSEYVDRDELFA